MFLKYKNKYLQGLGTGVAIWKYDGGDIIYIHGHGIVSQTLMGIKYWILYLFYYNSITGQLC